MAEQQLGPGKVQFIPPAKLRDREVRLVGSTIVTIITYEDGTVVEATLEGDTANITCNRPLVFDPEDRTLRVAPPSAGSA